MRTPFSSFPPQLHPNASAQLPQQQLPLCVPSQENPGNMLQNPAVLQAHMALFNPQVPTPLINPGVPQSIYQSGALNAPNPLPPSQNIHLGASQFGPLIQLSQPGQCGGALTPPLAIPNANTVSMFPVHGQLCNPVQSEIQHHPSHSQGHFALNLSYLSQQLNQTMGLSTVQQSGLQNLMQSMSQLLPLAIGNSSQVMPFSAPSSSGQHGGCLNPPLLANSPFGLLPPSQVMHHHDQNQRRIPDKSAPNPPSTTSQTQGNSNFLQNSSGVQQHRPHHLRSVFRGSEGKPAKKGQFSKDFPGKNSMRKLPNEGFQRSQFHQTDNERRRNGFHLGRKGQSQDWERQVSFSSPSSQATSQGKEWKPKFSSPFCQATGQGKERKAKFSHVQSSNPEKERKRALVLTYTEQEIQQWREERRKNYPSKVNVEKKLSGNQDSEVARRRCLQLKEILSKQAELGVEVAEIPSHYLADSEKNVHGRDDSRKLSGKRRFERKHDRGRRNKKDRFGKRQRLMQQDSPNASCVTKRSPTLLQKLLSADIRKDKSRLLQVFRFMVMNSFFKEWPDKTLKFPLVMVKESACKGELVEKSLLAGGGLEEGNLAAYGEDIGGHDGDSDSDHRISIKDDDNGEERKHEHEKLVEPVTDCVKGKISATTGIRLEEEEEGEIID